MANGDDAISKLKELNTTDSPNAGKILLLAFILPIVQFFSKGAEAIGALMDVFIVPVQTFIEGIGQLMIAILAGAAGIVGAASGASAESFRSGIFSTLGPFAFPLGIATVLMGALVMNYYLRLEQTSDLIPFSGTDFPLIGAEEEE